MEIHLPDGEPWTLRDVTGEILKAGENAVAQAAQEKANRLEEATKALAELVAERAAEDRPVLKTDAEIFLCKEQGLKQREARLVIIDKINSLWRLEKTPGKGSPVILYPVLTTKIHDNEKVSQAQVSEQPISVTQSSCGQQKSAPLKSTTGADSEDTPFLSSEEESTQPETWEEEI